MVQHGRVLVIEEGTCAQTLPLWDSVRANGYGVTLAPLEASAEAIGRCGRPDAVILNMIAADMAGSRGRYVEAGTRLMLAQGGRRLPMIALDDARGADRPVGISEMVAPPFSAQRLLSRIATSRRLATMQSEVRRRIETAVSFGVEGEELGGPIDAGDADLLLFGSGERYHAIEAALSRTSMITGAFTARTALDYLARRPFDAILIDRRADAAVGFLDLLRRDSAFYALPAIALVGDNDTATAERLFAAGATEIVAHANLAFDLARLTAGAVIEHRMRQSLLAVYARGRTIATNDALTGLYSRGFLMAHLDRTLEEARVFGTGVAVATVTIDSLPGINEDFGYACGDHVIRQVGQILARMVRAEDLVARFGAGRFVVVLPDSGPEAAETAIRRAAAVVRSTRLALAGTSAGFATIELTASVIAAGQADTAETTLRRTFSAAPV
jgi:diguanylate cyclase (GGDEF)-like protein